MKKKQTARLENWSVREIYGKLQCTGNVYGHPRLRDGDFIYTSVVVNFNKAYRTVETLNTFYTLGTPAAREENYN